MLPAQHQPGQLIPIGEISSPISDQMIEFCDPELFSAQSLQNCEATSRSNYCYDREHEEYSSYATNFSSITPEADCNFNLNNNTSHDSITTDNTPDASNLPIIFDPNDEMDNDISASIDFSVPPYLHHHQHFDAVQRYTPDHTVSLEEAPAVQPLLPAFDDDCLAYPASPQCSYMDPSVGLYLSPGSILMNQEGSFISANGAMYMGFDQQQGHEVEYRWDNTVQKVFNSGELQALTHEGTSLDDCAYKVGKLSVEQRKEKIDRYMKKRNQRNFNKKIKYACRKTLADSRPRVRGRFAKNEDLGENPITTCVSNHNEEDDDEAMAKGEKYMVDSSEIFAQISGLNSLKFNYPIQSWI